MKILITGAAGYLCQEAIAQLSLAGHTLRLSDIIPYETEHEFCKCDVLSPEDVYAAVDGMDAVFHTVLGGLRGQPRSPLGVLRQASAHFNVTVMGTWNILQAAAQLNVPKVVMIGSEAARGQRIRITDYEVVDEETPAKPDYVYAVAKYVMEPIAEYSTRIDGVQTAVLRNAWFGSARGKPVATMGTTLLFQRSVTRKDLVRAAVLALEKEDLAHEVFLLSGVTEFTKEDVPMLRADPEKVIEKYYPGAPDLLREYGANLQGLYDSKDLWKIDDISKSERILGWKPTFTFRDFYENLKAGKYPKDHIFTEELSK